MVPPSTFGETAPLRYHLCLKVLRTFGLGYRSSGVHMFCKCYVFIKPRSVCWRQRGHRNTDPSFFFLVQGLCKVKKQKLLKSQSNCPPQKTAKPNELHFLTSPANFWSKGCQARWTQGSRTQRQDDVVSLHFCQLLPSAPMSLLAALSQMRVGNSTWCSSLNIFQCLF